MICCIWCGKEMEEENIKEHMCKGYPDWKEFVYNEKVDEEMHKDR